MKVNVDVLVLNQVRSQANSVAIINQGKVSENQYQTYTGHDVSITKIYNSNVQIYVMQNSYTKIF